MKLYFKDNFFNSGKTEILGEQKEVLGMLDLKSGFSSSMDVYDGSGTLVYSGKFPFFSSKWDITNPDGEVVGKLRSRMSFSQKYEYTSSIMGCFQITSPAFSKEYEIHNENGGLIASFEKISGWFSSEAYCLNNHSLELDTYELVAVIMGMNAIKRQQQNA